MTRYILVVAFAIILVLLIGFSAILVSEDLLFLPEYLALDIGTIVGLGFGIIFFKKIGNIKLRILPKSRVGYKIVLKFASLAALILILTDTFFIVIMGLKVSNVKNLLWQGNGKFYIIFSMLVLYPILEEVFFRGFLYIYCKEKVSLVAAICIPTILLYFGHNANSMIIINSLVIIYCFEKTGFLATNILIHMIWNGYVVLLNI